MTHRIKKGTTPFGEEEISSVEDSGEDRHGISHTKARVKEKIRSHDQCCAEKCNGESTPEPRREFLFQDQPGAKCHPEGSRIAQECGVSGGCKGEGGRPQPEIAGGEHAGQQGEYHPARSEQRICFDPRQKKRQQQKDREEEPIKSSDGTRRLRPAHEHGREAQRKNAQTQRKISKQGFTLSHYDVIRNLCMFY